VRIEKMLANVTADAREATKAAAAEGEMEATPRESPYPSFLSG